MDIHDLLEGKNLLIFDFDGTIADTSSLHAEAFSQTLRPLGLEPDYESIAGLKSSDAIRKCLESRRLARSEREIEFLVRTKQSIVRNLISAKLVALPGVNQFLQLARTRFHIALASSGSKGTVNLALQKLGLEGVFSAILCAEDAANGKPSPEIFLKTLERFGRPPEEALIFEDSESGLNAAKRAGIESHDIRTSGWEPFARYAEIYWK